MGVENVTIGPGGNGYLSGSKISTSLTSCLTCGYETFFAVGIVMRNLMDWGGSPETPRIASACGILA
jgi:hypothetical protein